MINIAKLLKNYPKGTKLYSPLFGEVELVGVNNDCTQIRVIYKECFPKVFLSDGRYLDYPNAECLLFPSKDRRTWKGWKLLTKPRFKVHDWIIFNKAFTLPTQVIDIKEKDNIYVCRTVYGRCGNYSINEIDRNYHLWSIEDANDGDVLTNGKLIVIFNKLEEPAYKQHIIAYVGLDLCGRLQITEDTWQLGADKAMPATEEQRDLFFAKMKEAGYRWNSDKKELYKIKPHYDISNFHAGMPVLVRDGDCGEWRYTLFSHYRKLGTPFAAGGQFWFQCIPFIEDTKHLVGTTDMPNEEYINW